MSLRFAQARMKVVLVLFLLLLSATTAPVRYGRIHVPDEYNPWSPLILDAKPNFLTGLKLQRLSKDTSACLEVLSSSGFAYASLPDRITGYACGFHNAVRIDKTSSEPSEPFSLSCRAAVSLALWERHVLQPKALEYFGAPVIRIEHFGSYSCRNVYGRPRATRSRHATAEAFDIAGFQLATGERIRVLKDWPNEDRNGQFLRDIRRGACRFFDAVLSPDYNTAHRDHFHLDRGPYRACR
jgi:hypothetical protein